MKYFLIIGFLAFWLLSGFGCLEDALEYPKEFNQSVVDSWQSIETVEIIGVVTAVDANSNFFQIISANGLSEDVFVSSEATISWNEIDGKNFSDILPGSLAKVFGTRDPANLVITARTVRAFDNPAIFVTAPLAGATITSPLIVGGFVNFPGADIFWRLKDQDNNLILSGGQRNTFVPNSFSPLHLEIFLPVIEINNFTLEIFTKNLLTKVEENFVSLSLNSLSIDKSEFNVFFANDRLNTTRACNLVFPVKRTIAETSAVGRASLLQILNGPTEAERYQGYRSSLPFGTTINSLVISGGVATVAVSNDFKKLSTCETQRAEAQIRQTLLQVSLVKEVVILME